MGESEWDQRFDQRISWIRKRHADGDYLGSTFESRHMADEDIRYLLGCVEDYQRALELLKQDVTFYIETYVVPVAKMALAERQRTGHPARPEDLARVT